jgi:tRNA-Thr(GGU) m(6)t(6)A37 methyltransferase TsaA
MQFESIGVMRCAAQYSYDAARQPTAARGGGGVVELHPGRYFDVALRDLTGFSRIWLLYAFDRNTHWKPLVSPPRANRKMGVFATRAPYRPNPIGMSCVELLRVEGLHVHVGPHDLLDGTPILDIKPYVPYADAFPEARTGWLEEVTQETWALSFAPEAEAQLAWLEARGLLTLRPYLLHQLAENPFETERKRIKSHGGNDWEIAYRTWRARYTAYPEDQSLTLTAVSSGYLKEELHSEEDPHADKALHRDFLARFTGPGQSGSASPAP